MIELIKPFAEWCSAIIEAFGVGLITVIAFYALIIAIWHLFKGQRRSVMFQDARQRLGRGILIGLEFLVAADIIHTVAVDLAFRTVGVLFIIVLIRTFLSFTLEVELTGNWPWQHEKAK